MIENFLEKNIFNKVKLFILCYDIFLLFLDIVCNWFYLLLVEFKNYCYKLNVLFGYKFFIYI